MPLSPAGSRPSRRNWDAMYFCGQLAAAGAGGPALERVVGEELQVGPQDLGDPRPRATSVPADGCAAAGRRAVAARAKEHEEQERWANAHESS